MHARKSLKHWSSLFIGLGGLCVILSPLLAAAAADLTVTDSISPETDFLMPFGPLEVGAGSTAEQSVTITNPGTVARELITIRISGEGAGAFTLDVNGGAKPCGSTTPLIDVGDNCTVTLRFIPDATGLRTAFLNLSLEEEKIAFHNDTTNGISLYGLSTKNISSPTSGTGDDFPSWSPDGAQLAFHRNSVIYRMPSNGGVETLISDINKGGRATMPDWSPDGNKIVMRETANGGLFLFDLSQELYVNIPGASAVSGERHYPDWSPDSQKIVFQQNPPTGPNPVTTNIFTMNSDATNQNLITLRGKSPAWSPNGQQIIFQEDATNVISRADAGGGLNTTTPLTFPLTGSEDSQPSWSPDGDKIVFRRAVGSEDTDNGQLFIIDAETGNLLVTLPATGRSPAWSPASLSNITLTGTGLAAAGANNPPTAPILVSPQNGETGLSSSVEFKWLPASDPDGDTLTYELLLCNTADYPNSCPTPTVVSKITQQGVSVYAASGGLFLVGIVFMAAQRGRKKQGIWLRNVLFLVGIVLLGACDSGGGGSTPPDTGGGGTELTSIVESLVPETSYNWKITAKDGNGGVTDSLVRTFSTAP